MMSIMRMVTPAAEILCRDTNCEHGARQSTRRRLLRTVAQTWQGATIGPMSTRTHRAVELAEPIRSVQRDRPPTPQRAAVHKSRSGSHRRGALLFGLALPVCIVAALLAPQTMSSALGCTGGVLGYSGTPGWWGMSFNAQTIRSDGVVVLRGAVNGLSAQEAYAAAQVSVTTTSGGDVAGTTTLIDDLGVPVGGVTSRAAALVFRPSAPMAPGEYTIHVGTRTALLRVLSGTIPAPKLATFSSKFVTAAELAGPVVTCPARRPCGEAIVHELPAGLAKRPGILVDAYSGSTGAPRAFVYDVEAVPGKGTLLPARARALVEGAQHRVSLLQGFSDDVAEYCVRVVRTNLQDDTTVKSQPVCATRGEPALDATEEWLDLCPKPPANGGADADGGCQLGRPPPHEAGITAALLALAGLIGVGIARRRRRLVI